MHFINLTKSNIYGLFDWAKLGKIRAFTTWQNLTRSIWLTQINQEKIAKKCQGLNFIKPVQNWPLNSFKQNPSNWFRGLKTERTSKQRVENFAVTLSDLGFNQVHKSSVFGAFFRSILRLNRFCAIKYSHTKPLIKPL